MSDPNTSQIFVYDPGVAERNALKLDSFEASFLSLARHIFATFDQPQSHCWMSAFMEAEQTFPPPFGATIAHAVVIAVTELRTERLRTFSYFRNGSALSDQATTREERYLLLVLRGIRCSNPGAARANAMLVCEGGSGDGLLAALERLCIITGDVDQPQFA